MANKPWLKTFCLDINGVSTGAVIPDESVDVSVFSPPYKKKNGYSDDLMVSLGGELGRVLRPGGLVFMNFGQLSPDFGRAFRAHQLVLEAAQEAGDIVSRQTIAWVKSIAMPSWRHRLKESIMKTKISYKNSSRDELIDFIQELRSIVGGPGETISRGHFTPINSNKILNYCWEPIFIFCKKPVSDFDKLAVGVAYADQSNLKRGTRGKNGNVHCRGDTWFLPHETTGAKKKKEHKDEFPEALVRQCLHVANLSPGATVYEPFLGGGTTARVALEMGFNVYGTDKDREAVMATVRRCRDLL